MEPNVVNVEDINESLRNNKSEYISHCEEKYKKQILEVTENIIKKGDVKFILLAGPSSSGKTTTSKILTEYLKEKGITARPISLDDFFLERSETPKWENGDYNFETADAIDWNLFSSCMKKLLNNESVKLPTYLFGMGTKVFGESTVLEENSVLIIEGLHALNPVIDNFIPTKNSYKIYISCNYDIYNNQKLFMYQKDIRLFRRMIRDLFTRSTSIQNTLKMWERVMLGEKLYIDPFVYTAEYEVNSFLLYELGIYKSLLQKLHKEDNDLIHLINQLEPFDALEQTVVPKDSLLQEFVPDHIL